MPVTKTAKRALRGSARKTEINNDIRTKLDIAMRRAKKTPTKDLISSVFSLADRAVKKNLIHKNKSARIKAALARVASK